MNLFSWLLMVNGPKILNLRLVWCLLKERKQCLEYYFWEGQARVYTLKCLVTVKCRKVYYYNFTQGITTIFIYISIFPSTLKTVFNLEKSGLESAIQKVI